MTAQPSAPDNAATKQSKTSTITPARDRNFSHHTGLNPAWIIAVPITIYFGSSTAPNENLVLILFKFRLGKNAWLLDLFSSQRLKPSVASRSDRVPF
jgi:hypothetical protein